MSGAARGAHKCQSRKGNSQISGEARRVHKFQVRPGELTNVRSAAMDETLEKP
jgi:hypothetical protein